MFKILLTVVATKLLLEIKKVVTNLQRTVTARTDNMECLIILQLNTFNEPIHYSCGFSIDITINHRLLPSPRIHTRHLVRQKPWPIYKHVKIKSLCKTGTHELSMYILNQYAVDCNELIFHLQTDGHMFSYAQLSKKIPAFGRNC